MRRLFCRLKSGESGQSVVEFALVLPIFLLLVMGLIQFGAIFNGQITVTSAAREGARLGVVGTPNPEVRDRLIEHTAALFLQPLTPSDIMISPTEQEFRVVGQELTVRVSGTVPIIVPGFNLFLGNSYPVSGEAVMRIETLPQ